MAALQAHFWKKTPFIRLLIAMMAGILLEWHLQLSIFTWYCIFFIALFIFSCFFILPFFQRYRLTIFNSLAVLFLFLSAGAIFTWQKDIRNNKNWLGNIYETNNRLIATIEEPPVEKTKSIKANASIHYIIKGTEAIPVTGKIIVYFKKSEEGTPGDSLINISYGSQIIINKPLQEIKNSGNPGGFDYKRYSLFQGITHQVYLKQEDFEVLNTKNENWFRKFLYSSREKVLTILRQHIKGNKELGLAEAMLIGYKDDLEQSLVQSYTNTGVVHIIAISGLHLGLIYWLLAILLRPLKKKRNTRWLSPVLIITGLWLFSLLAGAQPSILRSALMFTCIVLGESLSKKSSIYNTMAVSAFILLCINPFWLWDVGFQLSYAAVLSIIIFMRPIYNWFYIKNKILDSIWKLNAVTIAAQILTVPLGIYHFHQFPNLFLLTNFLAVPLSSAILLGEIFLCTIAFIPAIAGIVGKLLSWLIWVMNTYIEKIEGIPFSLWDGLQISIMQSILLVIFAATLSNWLMEKSSRGLKWSLVSLLAFVSLRSYSLIESKLQQKIIVYNVPQKTAIDFLNGRQYQFAGDSDLLFNDFARNFHLKPSRILNRVKEVEHLPSIAIHNNYINYQGKNILLIDKTVSFLPQESKPIIDLLILSKNPKVYIKKLAKALYIKQVVFDGSIPAWKTTYLKKDCDSLHIPWHDVTMNGAFEMKVN